MGWVTSPDFSLPQDTPLKILIAMAASSFEVPQDQLYVAHFERDCYAPEDANTVTEAGFEDGNTVVILDQVGYGISSLKDIIEYVCVQRSLGSK